MKGLLVGLVLGFALGAVVMHTMRDEVDEQRAPPPNEPALPAPTSFTPEMPDAASKQQEPAVPPLRRDTTPAERAVLERYMQRDPVKELTDTEVLELLERLLSPAESWQVRLYELNQRLEKEIQRRASSPGGFSVPRSLVKQFLAVKGNVPLRNLGGRLLFYADPPMIDVLPGLITRDANGLIRRSALQAWIVHGTAQSDYLDVLLAATKGGDSQVKFRAARALASTATHSPRAAKWLFEVVSGSDALLKEACIGYLGLLGTQGIDWAAKLLVDDEHIPDHTRTLAKILIDAGRTDEILTVLNRDPSDRVIRALISAVAGAEVARQKQALHALTGHFTELYERLRRYEDADLAEFLWLAVKAGELALIRRIATSRDSDPLARHYAIEFAAFSAELYPAAVEGARSVLGDPKAESELRLGVIEVLGAVLQERAADESPVPGEEDFRKILREVVAREKDPKILDAAKEALGEE